MNPPKAAGHSAGKQKPSHPRRSSRALSTVLIRPPEARAVCCSRHLLSGTASLLALNARRNAAKHITTCCAIAPLLGSFRKGLTSTVFASYFRRAVPTNGSRQPDCRQREPHRGRLASVRPAKGTDCGPRGTASAPRRSAQAQNLRAALAPARRAGRAPAPPP